MKVILQCVLSSMVKVGSRLVNRVKVKTRRPVLLLMEEGCTGLVSGMILVDWWSLPGK